MSATTVSNIVASMEALMGQVKELQARASACEAKEAAEALACSPGVSYGQMWDAIGNALSAEERIGLQTHEAVQKMAAELIKLRALAAATAAPAVGSSAPLPQAGAPPAAAPVWRTRLQEHSRKTWVAISSVIPAEERNALWAHEAVEKMAAELMKLRQQVAAAAAPAGGSSAPPAPQAAPPAPAGVAALAAEVAEQKKQEAKQDAELMAAVPGDVKRKLAWRFTGAGSTKKGEETWPYYKEERALAAVAVLLKEYGVKAEAESVAGTDLWHVTVSEEQMERLKAAVMK